MTQNEIIEKLKQPGWQLEWIPGIYRKRKEGAWLVHGSGKIIRIRPSSLHRLYDKKLLVKDSQKGDYQYYTLKDDAKKDLQQVS